jgi:hypothetical protein
MIKSAAAIRTKSPTMASWRRVEEEFMDVRTCISQRFQVQLDAQSVLRIARKVFGV